jgi:hypothetical protein
VFGPGRHAHQGLAPAEVGRHVGVGPLAHRRDLAGRALALARERLVERQLVVEVQAVGRVVAGVVEGQALAEADAVAAGDRRQLLVLVAHEHLGHVQLQALRLGQQRVAVGVVHDLAQAVSRHRGRRAGADVAKRAQPGPHPDRRQGPVGHGGAGRGADPAVGLAGPPGRRAQHQERGDRQQLLLGQGPGRDQVGRVADEALLGPVGQDGVDVGVGQVGQRVQLVAPRGGQLDATGEQRQQGVEGLLADLARGQQVVQVLLRLDRDEGLVRVGARGRGRADHAGRPERGGQEHRTNTRAQSHRISSGSQLPHRPRPASMAARSSASNSPARSVPLGGICSTQP